MLLLSKTPHNLFFQRLRDKESKRKRSSFDGEPEQDDFDGVLEQEEITLNVAGYRIPKSDAEDLLTNLFRHCALGEVDAKDRLANSSWKRRESIRGMCLK